MPEPLPIPHTLKVLTDHWSKAESETRKAIRSKHQDADEEFITRLFFGELRFALEKANRTKKVQNSFLADLKLAFQDNEWLQGLNFDFEQFVDGIVAQACPHNRYMEGMTGGDFGVTISRPIVGLHNYHGLH